MDCLPQRSKEALKRQALTTRKGRTRPANLREQVNPEAVTIYENASTWRTPAASEPGVSIDRLQTKEGGPPQSGERLYDKETGRNCQYGLTQQVQMKQQWPTPNTSDANAPNMSPGADGIPHDLKKGYLRGVVKASWPTPCAHEARLGYQDRSDPNKKGTQESLTTVIVNAEGGRSHCQGHLNPDWVEKMMGVPPGWTALDGTSGEWDGVDEWIDGSWGSGPRIVEQCENRVDRVRLLGNGVVPATAALAYLTLSEELKR